MMYEASSRIKAAPRAIRWRRASTCIAPTAAKADGSRMRPSARSYISTAKMVEQRGARGHEHRMEKVERMAEAELAQATAKAPLRTRYQVLYTLFNWIRDLNPAPEHVSPFM